MAVNRLRLTIVYGCIWTAVLCGLLFLGLGMVERNERASASSLLTADFGVMKGFLRIENDRLMWYFDQTDPAENAVVSRLRRNLVVFDALGNVMETGHEFDRAESRVFATTIRSVRQTQANLETMTRGRDGKPLLLLCGQLRDEHNQHQYYAFLGRSIPENYPSRGLRNGLLLWFLATGLSFSLSALMVRHCTAT